MLKPSIRKPVQAPIASARLDSGAASVTAASVPATAKAAPSPCSARAPTTIDPAGAMAIINEASANNPIPAVEEYRAPNWSAASPPRIMNIAAVSRYALTTHSTSEGPRCRLLVIAGRPAMIAVLLSPTDNIARQQAISTGLKSHITRDSGDSYPNIRWMLTGPTGTSPHGLGKTTSAILNCVPLSANGIRLVDRNRRG